MVYGVELGLSDAGRADLVFGFLRDRVKGIEEELVHQLLRIEEGNGDEAGAAHVAHAGRQFHGGTAGFHDNGPLLHQA